MSIYTKLFQMQQEFKSAKDGFNKFGNFKFRNFENMMATLKPILEKNKCVILVDHSPIDMSTGVYINTKVTLIDIEDNSSVSATSTVWDGDKRERKELCNAQISGGSMSYGAKYALGFLMGVAAEQDPDAYEPNNTPSPRKNMSNDRQPLSNDRQPLSKAEKIQKIICEINTCMSIDELKGKWSQLGNWTNEKSVKDAFTARKSAING